MQEILLHKIRGGNIVRQCIICDLWLWWAVLKVSILAKCLQGLTGRSMGYSGQEGFFFITTGCLTQPELKRVIKSCPGFLRGALVSTSLKKWPFKKWRDMIPILVACPADPRLPSPRFRIKCSPDSAPDGSRRLLYFTFQLSCSSEKACGNLPLLC